MDHSQTIGGDTAKLLGDISPHPPLFRPPLSVSRLLGSRMVANSRVRLATQTMRRGVHWKDALNADCLERASGPAGDYLKCSLNLHVKTVVEEGVILMKKIENKCLQKNYFALHRRFSNSVCEFSSDAGVIVLF